MSLINRLLALVTPRRKAAPAPSLHRLMARAYGMAEAKNDLRSSAYGRGGSLGALYVDGFVIDRDSYGAGWNYKVLVERDDVETLIMQESRFLPGAETFAPALRAACEGYIHGTLGAARAAAPSGHGVTVEAVLREEGPEAVLALAREHVPEPTEPEDAVLARICLALKEDPAALARIAVWRAAAP